VVTNKKKGGIKMDNLNDLLGKLIEENNVDLKNEHVVFAFKDGFVSMYLEDSTLKVNVEFVDQVIQLEDSLGDITGLVD
jgi:hypothetical protein